MFLILLIVFKSYQVLTQLRRLVKKLCNYMATVVDEHVAMELGLPLEREENDIDKKAEIESFKEDLKVVIRFFENH